MATLLVVLAALGAARLDRAPGEAPRLAAGVAAPHAAARGQRSVWPPVSVDGPLDRAWRQRAVHALVVPLLDLDVARFAQPTLVHPCRGEADVEVDGRPYPSGEPLPDRPFTIRWRMDGCAPLGADWLELTGDVVVRVQPGTAGALAVEASPAHLVAHLHGREERLTTPVRDEVPGLARGAE